MRDIILLLSRLFFCVCLGVTVMVHGETDKDQASNIKNSYRHDLSHEDKLRVWQVTRATNDFSSAEKYEKLQGGAGTSLKIPNHHAFSQFSANLPFADQQNFFVGNGLFRKIWVSSPASTKASDGLGPLFNARSCQSCHVKDGRGRPPEGSENSVSMFLRLGYVKTTPLSWPTLNIRRMHELNTTVTAWINKTLERSLPDPVYGHQLQHLAVPGIKAEGQMKIVYTEKIVIFADGSTVSLRKPHYSVENLAYGSMHPNISLSPRIANPMIGLGLVEAIHPDDILALADPLDKNKDGISGKAAFTKDSQTGEMRLGRFGWKAQEPNIKQQSAGAFATDIGISTPLHPSAYGDCTKKQHKCFHLPTGVQESLGDTEAPDPVLELVTFYSRNLAVPVRRLVDDTKVLRGKRLFYQNGCIACHTPKFVTRRDAIHKAQSFQLIWPYSDFLLHDMGEGLADNQVVGVANGREWRTPPLWGIGLTKTVSDHTFFLHDGRARNLTEAILWHGGEAKLSKQHFMQLTKADREDLLVFLKSL